MIALESLYAPFEMVSCHNATCERRFLPMQRIPAWSRPTARMVDIKKPASGDPDKDDIGRTNEVAK
jgi:hypothetical protein